MSQKQNSSGLNIFIGMVAFFAGHIVAVALMAALANIRPIAREIGDLLFFAFFGIGLTQLIYVVPLCLWLQQRNRTDTFKGVLIAAAVTLLLNGGCFIWFWTSFPI